MCILNPLHPSDRVALGGVVYPKRDVPTLINTYIHTFQTLLILTLALLPGHFDILLVLLDLLAFNYVLTAFLLLGGSERRIKASRQAVSGFKAVRPRIMEQTTASRRPCAGAKCGVMLKRLSLYQSHRLMSSKFKLKKRKVLAHGAWRSCRSVPARRTGAE